MNFLAHIYLSFGDDEITVGNFIADSIRGNKFSHLPPNIQRGIRLHREIDTFTDAHPIARQSSKRLHVNYSHYSRVIVDIFYDHFLACNWDTYSDMPLEDFTEKFYDMIETHYAILPIGIKRMMPYMIADNWLLSYGTIEGIGRVLNGMNRRTQNRSKMQYAIVDLEAYYGEFEREFSLLFEELIIFSRQKIKSL